MVMGVGTISLKPGKFGNMTSHMSVLTMMVCPGDLIVNNFPGVLAPVVN